MWSFSGVCCSQHFLAGHRDYKWMKYRIYVLKMTRHKAEWKVLPEATLWEETRTHFAFAFAFAFAAPTFTCLRHLKPFLNAAPHLTLCISAARSVGFAYERGKGGAMERRGVWGGGAAKPLYLVFTQCSAELCGVGKKTKTKNKNAVSHFRSLSISRFFKSSRKRKKKSCIFGLRILQSHSNSEPPRPPPQKLSKPPVIKH